MIKDIGIAGLALFLGTLGSMVLQAQTNDTKLGTGTLAANTTGSSDTAIGTWALQANTTGNSNTAVGASCLDHNTTGSDNSALGEFALQQNINGTYNAALGFAALQENTSGSSNTAMGANSLQYNNTGYDNSAFGASALASNTSGADNVAVGYDALYQDTTGYSNVAIGMNALDLNTTGAENIAIGMSAGFFNPVGASYNIDIGNWGRATDTKPTIRIGQLSEQTAFYAAGISGVQTGLTGAVSVMIDANGQLGTINSSIRFKQDVHDMAAASDGLMRLRPVTFRYRQPYADGSRPIDYGLIAEEVAEVYPDLVARDADGQIQTVQYQKLTPMLLNEVQKEHLLLQQQEAIVQQQAETIQQLEKRLAALEAALPSLRDDSQPAER